MNLEVIIDRLEQKGVGESGKSLFINFIPQDLTGILLRDYFGGTRVDHELPGRFKAKFMLIARERDYESARALVIAASKALTVKSREQLGSVAFDYMRPMGLPFAYAPTPGQNVEVALNLECCYVDAAFPSS